MEGLIQHKRNLYKLRREGALRKLDVNERKLIFSARNSGEATLRRKFSTLLTDYYTHINKCFELLSPEGKTNLIAEFEQLDRDLVRDVSHKKVSK